ncbi:unnamed protein product [Meganyctiphanes norvegica]|uniref:B box-type domain-containing protein n=1 Tax=Meganyctiphanes norvegica TaxID=48144 RepID=A0AAV2S4M2_MEGNR
MPSNTSNKASKKACKAVNPARTSAEHALPASVETASPSRTALPLAAVEVSAFRGPTLHRGECDEHGAPKVHYCLTHKIYICSDCVVAYHMDSGCNRVSIKVHFDNEKSDLCRKLDSDLTSLQEAGNQIGLYQHYYEESKTRIEKLLEGVNISIARYSAMKSESEDKKRKNITTKAVIQNSATSADLDSAIKKIKTYDDENKLWANKVKDSVKQSLGEIFTSPVFPRIILSREYFATYTAEKQRWGRITNIEGFTVIQNFSTDVPPSGANIVNLKDLDQLVSSPRHIYFNLEHDSVNLGRLIICLNDEGAPRWAEQMVTLALGKDGNTWTGSTYLKMSDEGSTGEKFIFREYLRLYLQSYQNSYRKLYSNLETGCNIQHKQGLVVRPWEGHAYFSILTRCGHTQSYEGPALGQVVSGLPVLARIINEGLVNVECDKSKVVISDSGLIINPFLLPSNKTE